jgi:imidazolonepropionase-like amidohydrolase
VLWITGARIADPLPREGALCIEGAAIAGEARQAPAGAPSIDASGLFLVPAFLDAHVHLAIAGDVAQVAREELRRGVAAVLDLGAPERLLPLQTGALRTAFSGPMLTAPGGYPTQSWGKGGFGLEIASADEARTAVARLAAAGARFAKLAFDARFALLAEDVARAAADEAHRRGLLVAAHALDAASVRRALDAGSDVLAHTPTEELPADLMERLRGRWVISTLRAFAVAPARLRALLEAGARVAYGTDLGNQGTAPGIDGGELSLLAAAGADPLRAATLDAAELLGCPDLGRLSPGSAASLLAVRGLDPGSLAAPVWVMSCGRLLP